MGFTITTADGNFTLTISTDQPLDNEIPEESLRQLRAILARQVEIIDLMLDPTVLH